MKLGLPVQWQIGGAFLFVGGALSLAGSIVFQFGPSGVGSILTLVAILFEGAGLLTISFGFGTRRVATWVRRLLFVVGILTLIEFLDSIALVFAPGPAASSVVVVLLFLTFATLLISAVGIARSPALAPRVRYALLPAAIYGALDFVLIISGHGGEWWSLGILGALYALAGILYFVSGRRAGSLANPTPN